VLHARRHPQSPKATREFDSLPLRIAQGRLLAQQDGTKILPERRIQYLQEVPRVWDGPQEVSPLAAEPSDKGSLREVRVLAANVGEPPNLLDPALLLPRHKLGTKRPRAQGCPKMALASSGDLHPSARKEFPRFMFELWLHHEEGLPGIGFVSKWRADISENVPQCSQSPQSPDQRPIVGEPNLHRRHLFGQRAWERGQAVRRPLRGQKGNDRPYGNGVHCGA